MSAVVDTSALIALGHLKLLRLLPSLFGDIIIPTGVLDEWLLGDRAALDLMSAGEALERDWLEERRVDSVPESLIQRLGCGEAEAITLAQSTGADFLVVDDRVARNTAIALSIPVIGTVGVLVAARRRGFIPSVSPLLDDLKERGFGLSDEVADAVRREEQP